MSVVAEFHEAQVYGQVTVVVSGTNGNETVFHIPP